jgi:phosphohistidine phosphatase
VSRELWFLRHGEAEDDGEDPPLTARGRQQAEAAGAALSRLGLSFDAVFTSPRARARESADLVCAALGCDPTVHEPLSGGFGGDDALDLFSRQAEGARLLVVGHEPDFSQTIEGLSGGDVDLKKGGVAALRIEGETGELISVLRPDEVEALGG